MQRWWPWWRRCGRSLFNALGLARWVMARIFSRQRILEKLNNFAVGAFTEKYADGYRGVGVSGRNRDVFGLSGNLGPNGTDALGELIKVRSA